MRAYAVGLVLACFVVVWFGVGLRSEPTTAQDQTGDRLSALETRVAELEDRVDVLEGDSPQIQPTIDARDSEAETGEIVISGTGSSVSEDFQLEAGLYDVTAAGAPFFLYISGPLGGRTLLLYPLNFDDEDGTASVIYLAPESGTYFIESSNTNAPWTVTFKPR
jgi:hypothetical protein